METRYLHRQLRNQNIILEEKVQERTQQLQQAELEALECLAAAGEYRDDDTGQHTQRVGEIAAQLACRLGMTESLSTAIRRAAPLHDVGKIGISDLILLKPGPLTPQEFAIMQQHTLIGAGILSRYHTPLLQNAQKIALTHHEHWDGRGYPHGLQGEDIPIEGRIVAVVDVFDALTHERPYKKAWTIDAALTQIESQSGKQFDEHVVKSFLSLTYETIL